jgi:hypothetical protein
MSVSEEVYWHPIDQEDADGNKIKPIKNGLIYILYRIGRQEVKPVIAI